MQNEFKAKLDSVRASAERVYKSSNDIKEICRESMDELTCYETIIPEFFSYNNEAVGIKTMYKKLKELNYTRNKVIPCIKVSCAGYLYDEYFEGMYTFIDNFFKEVSSNGPNVALMEKQLQTAIEGDPLFIDSLFGGKNNEVVNEELTSAVANIEYLVDFLELLKSIRQMVGDMCNRACELSGYDNSINVVRLAVNSTGSFSNRVIKTIIDTYKAINFSLDDKPTTSTNVVFKVF